MAVTNRIGSILIDGIVRASAFNKTSPYGLAGELDEIIDFSLEDSQESSELRAGPSNSVIYKKYGNRTVGISMTNGTLSAALLKLYTGQNATIKTSTMPIREKGLALTNSVATLSKTPATGKAITVYTTDSYGRNLNRLEATSGVVSPTTYKLATASDVTTITVDSTITGKLNVWYEYSEEIEEVSGKGGSGSTYRLEIDCVWYDVTTDLKYSGVIEFDSASLAPSYTIQGKNSNDVPDPQTVEFTILSKMGEEPYKIKFAQQVAE